LDSCGGKGQGPEDFYADLVKNARAANGGYMYDVLDSAQRASIDTMIGMQMANLDKIPPSERARWDSLKGQSKRDIYGKILTSDKGLSDIFKADYKIVKIDTLVLVQVQHTGQEPNTIYLHPKGGSYEIATPPRPPSDGMPAEHPPVEAPPSQQPPAGKPGAGSPGAPQGSGSAPSAAPNGGPNGGSTKPGTSPK
jgi:hypothetical protein